MSVIKETPTTNTLDLLANIKRILVQDGNPHKIDPQSRNLLLEIQRELEQIVGESK
jgi:hypothetical protein